MSTFDATPVIYLAKTERLELLTHLEGRCVIPERVYEEIVDTGIEEGYPGAAGSNDASTTGASRSLRFR